MEDRIDTDLESLVQTLPPNIRESLEKRADLTELLEVVLDLGRDPEARFLSGSFLINSREITAEDLRYVVDRIGVFGEAVTDPLLRRHRLAEAMPAKE